MTAPPRTVGWRRLRTRHSPIRADLSLAAQEILYGEQISGAVLMLSAALALFAANSPWRMGYESIWTSSITIDLVLVHIEEDFRQWINDFLMAFFFLQMGLEIKEEILFGRLSMWKKAALPVSMAAGGMLFPATLFLLFTWNTPERSGWAIPMATDIAFALGVMAILRSRVDRDAKLLLLTMAIVDDMGSIIVIAAFYTHDLSWKALAAALIPLAVLFLIRQLKIRSLSAYLIAGAFLWIAIFKSGVHSTLAGVILAAFIPARRLLDLEAYRAHLSDAAKRMNEATDEQRDTIAGEIAELTEETEAPLERLRRELQPWVSFLVLPLFGLANAGINFRPLRPDVLGTPVVLGILAGLMVGKPAGTLIASWIAVKTGLAQLPSRMPWSQLMGTAILSGIGFTVSIFIAGLTFSGQTLVVSKAAILVASITMAICGIIFFRLYAGEERRARSEERGAKSEKMNDE